MCYLNALCTSGATYLFFLRRNRALDPGVRQSNRVTPGLERAKGTAVSQGYRGTEPRHRVSESIIVLFHIFYPDPDFSS